VSDEQGGGTMTASEKETIAFVRRLMLADGAHGEHRDDATWREHQDINAVMLATSLAPDGYLAL
jgi:hypothetical protein